MNFVKNHNQYGVEAKEIPCLTGYGEPTTETEGAVGCLYMDKDTGAVYKCTSATDGSYVWEAFASGSSSDSGGADSYIFTGVYELREDGRYLVFTNDDFSWETLAGAVHDSKYVGCVLYDDNRDDPIRFSLGGAWFNDGYVVFNAIRENGLVYELRVFEDGSAFLQKYNTKNYIITGTYTLDDYDKINSVTLDDSFDYDEMVEAIKAGRYVAVRLMDEYDRLYHKMFNLRYWSDEESYVEFVYSHSTSEDVLEIWYGGGNYSTNVFRQGVIGHVPKIDLLWENPQCFDDDDAPIPFPYQTIWLPNAGDYDFFDVVFCKNVDETTTGRIFNGVYDKTVQELIFGADYNGAAYTLVRERMISPSFDVDGTPNGMTIYNCSACEYKSGTRVLATTDDSYLIPWRIYGTKGVNKDRAASSFTLIAGSERQMLTFRKYSPWGEWCASKYNTFGLSINSAGEVRYEADDSWVHYADSGENLRYDNQIIAGGVYELV